MALTEALAYLVRYALRFTPISRTYLTLNCGMREESVADERQNRFAILELLLIGLRDSPPTSSTDGFDEKRSHVSSSTLFGRLGIKHAA